MVSCMEIAANPGGIHKGDLTMDTSNRFELHFTLCELEESVLREDQYLADIAKQTMDELISKLKPILPYITSPLTFYSVKILQCPRTTTNGFKGVIVAREGHLGLFIDNDGQFRRGLFCEEAGMSGHWHLADKLQDQIEWRMFHLDSILLGLRDLLVQAEKKKESHLEKVSRRRQMLESIAAIAKSG